MSPEDELAGLPPDVQKPTAHECQQMGIGAATARRFLESIKNDTEQSKEVFRSLPMLMGMLAGAERGSVDNLLSFWIVALADSYGREIWLILTRKEEADLRKVERTLYPHAKHIQMEHQQPDGLLLWDW